MPPELLERLCSSDPEEAFPSVCIVAPHPDDEVIGAGGRLPFLRTRVSFVHVTDGSPRNLFDAHRAGYASHEEYAAARRQELAEALDLAGIALEKSFLIGLPDQQASFELSELAQRIAAHLEDVSPEVVLAPPYEGGHPDHDSTAFAVHAACRLLGNAAPAVIEYASYHAAPTGSIAPLEFLAWDGVPIRTVELAGETYALKSRMVGRFRTQQRTLSLFPLRFERFRPAPGYDFTQRPHGGKLYYEYFDWGITGEEWRRLSRAAMISLGLS
jgi:N-acetylglucosamine malate deacetylase 2